MKVIFEIPDDVLNMASELSHDLTDNEDLYNKAIDICRTDAVEIGRIPLGGHALLIARDVIKQVINGLKEGQQ